jgi:proton-dependent oligopeptide transporter, POT family
MTIIPSITQSSVNSGSSNPIGMNNNNNNIVLVLKPSQQTDDEIPNNVQTIEQLQLLPSECINKENDHRPLRHVDDRDNVYTYLLQPKNVILLILVVEMIERFSYYGVYYTQTLYLTGVYNPNWNAGYTSVEAASFVSLSTAVAYTTPFIGAYLSDTVLGDYQSIVIGSVCLYLPGLLLVALTSVPYLLGTTFNKTALSIAVLGLWPLGTGIVKSVVNVFGARQYHPLLQSAFIESYYVNFYTSINIGALVGISLLPIIAQRHVTIAYMIPVVLLSVGVIAFLSGTKHYVRSPPRGDICGSRQLKSHDNRNHTTTTTSSSIPLTTILRISLLIVPFCIAYSQMPTTFIIQGAVMNKAMYGFLDAASINIIDNVSVLTFGSIMSSYVYPYLVQKNFKLATTYKFAIGSFFGLLSLLWALFVEMMIRTTYVHSHQQISILWQTPSYVLIGIGEIFAVSAAYEAAFVASSPSTKALASAINIFCVGGLPNLFCIFLYKYCSHWFRNTRDGTTNLSHINDYVTAHIDHYFAVLVFILIIGIILNLLPPVRKFVDSTEQRATDLVKTPLLSKQYGSGDVESTPLLRRKFERPLMKMGSMRAGPSLRHVSMTSINPSAVRMSSNTVEEPTNYMGRIGLTKSIIHRLYHGHQNVDVTTSATDLISSADLEKLTSTTINHPIDRQETL